ncbi:MAG: hypothetical protein AAFO91_11595 [Bacteroidota bacterium]
MKDEFRSKYSREFQTIKGFLTKLPYIFLISYNKFIIMPIKITESKISNTKRRIDLVVKRSGLMIDTRIWKMRIVAGMELPTKEYELKQLLAEVIEKEKSWGQGKQSQYYRIPKFNATCYILKELTNEERSAN